MEKTDTNLHVLVNSLSNSRIESLNEKEQINNNPKHKSKLIGKLIVLSCLSFHKTRSNIRVSVFAHTKIM